MKPAVFLDRDGVLNEVRFDGAVAASARSRDEFTLIAGAAEAARRLDQAGFVLVVITNQPDVGRGLMDASELDAMHAALLAEVPIAAIEVCMHGGSDDCECRKPKPGMIVRAAERLGIDLSRSWTIGDRWVDIAAGRAAGTKTILIERPYSLDPTSSGTPPADLYADHVAGDLAAAAELIVPDGIR